MAKFFAWVLFFFSVAAFALGFRAQQILVEGEHARLEIAKPLPQSFAALECEDSVAP